MVGLIRSQELVEMGWGLVYGSGMRVENLVLSNPVTALSRGQSQL